jgi:alpha-L-fucosidase
MMALPPALSSRHAQPPQWWSEAKLGIFIHWVPASVPAYAPTERDITEVLTSGIYNPISETPYSEWYQNSLRFPGSSVARFHAERYGDRPYEEFADDFVVGTEQWDPSDWARRFAAAGAEYVVMVTKHHDGWCLWPTEVENPNRPGWHCKRDLVGELAEAVRDAGMRFGVYYSGGYDWTFDSPRVGTLADGIVAAPRGDYIEYATSHVRELIDRYEPDVLWNDISWPSPFDQLVELFEYYFRIVPDGVVNDRWMTVPDRPGFWRFPGVKRLVNTLGTRSVAKNGLIPPKPKFFQFRTPEFTNGASIKDDPWEVTRGMDKGFGYNHMSTEADYLSRDELFESLDSTQAAGGNFLLNIGPRGVDAQIPPEQIQRLDWLAERSSAE